MDYRMNIIHIPSFFLYFFFSRGSFIISIDESWVKIQSFKANRIFLCSTVIIFFNSHVFAFPSSHLCINIYHMLWLFTTSMVIDERNVNYIETRRITSRDCVIFAFFISKWNVNILREKYSYKKLTQRLRFF